MTSIYLASLQAHETIIPPRQFLTELNLLRQSPSAILRAVRHHAAFTLSAYSTRQPTTVGLTMGINISPSVDYEYLTARDK